MILRRLNGRTPRLALLGVALLALGPGALAARAGVGDYPSPLYLGGAESTLLPKTGSLSNQLGSNKLVAAAPPATPSAVTLAAGPTGPLSGSYSYIYTVVDPIGGESAVREGVAPSTSVTSKAITVNGLPTGVTVRLYRKKTALFTRVAELTNNASSSYTDSMDDTTASTQPNPPQAQNRIPVNTTAYQDFSPRLSAPFSGNTANSSSISTTPNGQGWIVDGAGGVTFPTDTWTFQAKLGQNASFGTARLVVGMWKVKTGAGSITSSTLLVDPTCSSSPCSSGAQPGENTTSFTTSGAVFSKLITQTVTVDTFSLASDEHIYVQYWRKQQTGMIGGSDTNRTATLFGYDPTTSIAHPVPVPVSPALGAVPARTNDTTPDLSATSDIGETGTISFELCTDSGCTTVLQSHTTTGVTNGSTATWTPTALAQGTYYWRARIQDGSSNLSGWSNGSFTVDTTAPNVPTLTSPAASARASQLTATHTETDTSDNTGTVTFQVCSDAAFTAGCVTNTSAALANGAATSWTPALPDGTYYWRVKAQDGATNASAWSAGRSFRLDTTAPGATTPSAPADGAQLASLPSFTATYVNADTGDSGPLSFQICADAACTNVQATGASATLQNNAVGSWKPSSLADGTHYVRVRTLDVAGNAGPWSAAQSFYLDMTPPSVPSTTGVGAGARLVRAPTLTASFTDNGGAAGTLALQLCSDEACGRVIASTTRTGVANGTSIDWAQTLGDGKYYWRAQATDSLGNTSAWSSTTRFFIDTTPPPAPTLVSAAGLRAKSSPALMARSVRSDPDEGVHVTFQLCRDVTCSVELGRGFTSADGGDVTAQWQPQGLGTGTYYWRAFAIDGAGNESGWSETRGFVIDTTPPSVPVLAAGSGDRMQRADLAAIFASDDPADTGSLTFQICSDAECSSVVSTGTTGRLTSGVSGRWTALLPDGVYYWRASAVDAAGNESAWSGTQQITLDTTPPGKPRVFKGELEAKTLTLRWSAPGSEDDVEAYILFVNGVRSRRIDADALEVDIHVRPGDRRSFAIAAIDSTGNIGAPTRSVVLVPRLTKLTIQQAKTTAMRQGLLLRWSKPPAGRPATRRVVGQTPAPDTLVETGTAVTVVVDSRTVPRR